MLFCSDGKVSNAEEEKGLPQYDESIGNNAGIFVAQSEPRGSVLQPQDGVSQSNRLGLLRLRSR